MASKTLRFCGQPVSASQLQLIAELAARYHRLSRQELTNTGCELLNWRRPNGQLKTRECRALLECWHEREALDLPALRAGRPRGSPSAVPRTAQGEPGKPVHRPLADVQPIRIERVATPAEHRLRRERVGRYHYLGYRVAFGASVRYLITATLDRPTVLGCLQFSSPAYGGRLQGCSREQLPEPGVDRDHGHGRSGGAFGHLGNCSCVALPPASMQSYRIAVGPRTGRKAFTLQTLPARADERLDSGLAKAAGFSLHCGVAAAAHQREKLERLCRYISRPALATERLSLTRQGHVRYRLKTPYRRRHHAHYPGTARFHRPPRRLSPHPARQPHPVPWGFRPESQSARGLHRKTPSSRRRSPTTPRRWPECLRFHTTSDTGRLFALYSWPRNKRY